MRSAGEQSTPNLITVHRLLLPTFRPRCGRLVGPVRRPRPRKRRTYLLYPNRETCTATGEASQAGNVVIVFSGHGPLCFGRCVYGCAHYCAHQLRARKVPTALEALEVAIHEAVAVMGELIGAQPLTECSASRTLKATECRAHRLAAHPVCKCRSTTKARDRAGSELSRLRCRR